MKDQVRHEEHPSESQVRYWHIPEEDECISMSQFLLSEERRKELAQACVRLKEYLADQRPLDKYHRLSTRELMSDGLTPWQIMQRRIPIELRAAYDSCGRLKRKAR